MLAIQAACVSWCTFASVSVCIITFQARGEVGLDPLMSIPLAPRSVTVGPAQTQRVCTCRLQQNADSSDNPLGHR